MISDFTLPETDGFWRSSLPWGYGDQTSYYSDGIVIEYVSECFCRTSQSLTQVHNSLGPASISLFFNKNRLDIVCNVIYKWCLNNKIHREDGPALETYSSDGTYVFHYGLDNRLISSKDDFMKMLISRQLDVNEETANVLLQMMGEE